MLGKCQWKMHQYPPQPGPEDCTARQTRPEWEGVVKAFVDAIETLPEEKKGREPILEPHYKLVSIVHKLVQFNEISLGTGCAILKNTRYARAVDEPRNADDWNGYVLDTLKSLQGADKSNWYHRMANRCTRVVHDSSPGQLTALAAKQEFCASTPFTKSMTMQVWKPENERPGRHYVYTTRYTRFCMQLLLQTGDREALETLARKVRKKANDYFRHYDLWHDLCWQYMMFLRHFAQVPEDHEDAVFKSIHNDSFQAQAARLEAWCHAHSGHQPALKTLQEVIELKRLNGNLMKASHIDDLIADTYAMLYAAVVPTLEPAVPTPATAGPPAPMAVASVMNPESSPASSRATTLHHYFQQDSSPARGRVKSVTRRDLLRRADASAARTAAPPPPPPPPPPPAPVPTPAPVSAPPTVPAIVTSPAIDAAHPRVLVYVPPTRRPSALSAASPAGAGAVPSSAVEAPRVSTPARADPPPAPSGSSAPSAPVVTRALNVDSTGTGTGTGTGTSVANAVSAPATAGQQQPGTGPARDGAAPAVLDRTQQADLAQEESDLSELDDRDVVDMDGVVYEHKQA